MLEGIAASLAAALIVGGFVALRLKDYFGNYLTLFFIVSNHPVFVI
jgi:hypothetical protein